MATITGTRIIANRVQSDGRVKVHIIHDTDDGREISQITRRTPVGFSIAAYIAEQLPIVQTQLDGVP